MLSKATWRWSLFMDKYDRMLLSALLEDGRASYAQLARTVNLSAPAVAERVAKLEASGVITGYQAKVDLSKVGLPIQCVIELRLTNHGSQKVYDALAEIPELTECHRVTGDPCVIMQAAVGSMPELENLINRIAKFGFSKTSIILSSAIERRVPLAQLEGCRRNTADRFRRFQRHQTRQPRWLRVFPAGFRSRKQWQ